MTFVKIKTNNPAVNPILEMMGNDYTGTLNVCRIICEILSQKLGLPNITLDEICFLMFYIQGEIISVEEKANVLLISDVSRSITLLIKRRLIQRFPGWQIRETYADGFKEINKGSYDVHVKETDDHRKSLSINYQNDFALGTWAPLSLCDGKTYHLDIFVDKCSVEIFVDGGRIAMTNLVFPTKPYNSLRFYTEGGEATISNLNIHRLEL